MQDDSGVLLAYALFTAASWERREGQLPTAMPPPELQLVDFGCRETAEPEVHRALESLAKAAMQAGPQCAVVCVVPAPLLPQRARFEGADVRVDTGWFYRVEGAMPEVVGDGDTLAKPKPQLNPSKHVVWTLDKF